MANYSTLDAIISSNIKTNGVQAITGAVLQGVLLDMVTALGKHYQLGGVATPAGAFSAGDENVAFLAVEAGTYTNYGGFTLDGKTLHVLAYNGTWTDTDTLIPSGAAVSAAIATALADYAKKDGFEPALVAGSAASFLGAPVEKIFQAYVARQSGPALIDQLKGNAIVWNQIVPINATTLSKTENGVTFTDNRDGSYTVQTDENGATADTYLQVPSSINFQTGHKYYMRGGFTGGSASTFYFRDRGISMTGFIDYGGDGAIFWYTSAPGALRPAMFVVAGTVITTPITFRPNYFDLSMMFGSGNEPATVADFTKDWPLNYYGYEAGSVLPFCADMLTAEDGTPDLPLEPQVWEDTDGFNIFPYGGMFGKGSAFDFAKVDADGYIRKATVVWERRAYAAGDESDASVITDGSTYTYQKKATPVEKTLVQPVKAFFQQAAGGTVSLKPANSDTPYTAPARMDLREPDAVSAGTLQNLLEAMKTAGVISAYTMTWDAASGTYQFTVTA